MVSLKIGIIYLFLGLLWMFFSDKFLESFSFSIETLSFFQTFKGFFFIFISAAVVFYLIYNHDNKLRVILQNYKDIFHSNADSIIILGYLDFEVIEVNESFKNVFKLSDYSKNKISILNILTDDLGFGINSFKKELATVREGKIKKFRWIFKSYDNKNIETIVTAKLSRYKHRDVFYIIIRDTSELKEMENALHKNSTLLEKAFDSVGLGVHIVEKKDDKFQIVYLNKQAKKILGIKHIFDINLSTIQFFDRNSNNINFGNLPFVKILEGKLDSYEDEIFIQNPGSEKSNVLLKAIPITNNAGEITACVSVLQDISKITEIRKAYKQYEARYRTLIETAPDAIFIFDANTGKIVDFNKKTLFLFKVSPEELVTLHPSDLSPELQPTGDNSFEKANRYIQAALKGGTPHFEWLHKNKYNQNIPCEVSLAKLPSEEGSFVRCTVVDISDRNLAEDMLNKTEKIYQEVISTTSDNITVHDASTGKLLEANETFLKTFMLNIDDIKDAHICDVYSSNGIYSATEFEEKLKTTLIDKVSEFKWKSYGNNDKEIWLELLLKYIEVGDESRIIAVSKNINEIMVAEQELLTLTKSLEEKNIEFRKVLYTTTHDLRTPLLNILGFSNELKQNYLEVVNQLNNNSNFDFTDLKEVLVNEWGDDINIIVDNTKKMSVLINGLLEMSKIGTYEVKNEDINVNLLIREIKKNLAHKIEKHKIRITVDQLPNCFSDKYKLQQVFTNLIDNAINYKKNDVESFIKITGSTEQNIISYSVEDNGIGIETENLDKVLEMFYRNDPELADGAGLGLTIVCKALETINGELKFESERNVGSKFSISLPNFDTNK